MNGIASTSCAGAIGGGLPTNFPSQISPNVPLISLNSGIENDYVIMVENDSRRDPLSPGAGFVILFLSSGKLISISFSLCSCTLPLKDNLQINSEGGT